MVFSSPLFLFLFLPITLISYYAFPRVLKNSVLLIASLAFYAWGEVFYIGVMLFSIGINYLVGRGVSAAREHGRLRASFIVLVVGVVLNLLLLVSYKYTNFIIDNWNWVFDSTVDASEGFTPVHLPLGISFFTFQAISYIVDVYRRDAVVQKNLFNLALYISLFPQLIAGPIVRYHDIAQQIQGREHSLESFGEGVHRFVYGLAKKMLLANPMAEVADAVFDMPPGELTMALAWVGILAYALQIYFDFSGYSDMAIGLGRMFGFRFLENFNYPYIATNVQDFWRRWHISLSTWFRDYLYIPLGGNRCSPFRVYSNLLVVFTLTGFWHGASWNFLVWGLFHGVFLSLERSNVLGFIRRLPKAFQHIYLLMVVLVGWVFFRAADLSSAIEYLGSMFILNNTPVDYLQLLLLVDNEARLAFVLAIFLCMPILPVFRQKFGSSKLFVHFGESSLVVALMVLSAVEVASSTYNPFIYFRF